MQRSALYDGTTALIPPPGLPPVLPTDLVPGGNRSWWQCRYCGGGESGMPFHVKAEKARCEGHEAVCPMRETN
jgi:hypothetical protein